MLNSICDWEPIKGLQYTAFNDLILQTAHQICTKPKFEDKSWFRDLKSFLLPAIYHQDILLYILRTAIPTAASFIKNFYTTLKQK